MSWAHAYAALAAARTPGQIAMTVSCCAALSIRTQAHSQATALVLTLASLQQAIARALQHMYVKSGVVQAEVLGIDGTSAFISTSR